MHYDLQMISQFLQTQTIISRGHIMLYYGVKTESKIVTQNTVLGQANTSAD
jgi:hypothetical protein